MKRKTIRIVNVVTATLIFALASLATQAIPLNWQISNVTFDDGGTLVGSFVFDADTASYSDVAVTSTLGSAYAGYAYPAGAALDNFLQSPNALFMGGNTPFGNNGAQLLRVAFLSPLTNAGGEIDLNLQNSWEGTENYSLCAILPRPGCEFPDVLRRVTSGSLIAAPVGAIPIPMSLGLFGLGLLGLGCARRQKP